MNSAPIVTGTGRIQLRYGVRDHGESKHVELPHKILLLGNFFGPSARPGQPRPIHVDRENLDRELSVLAIALNLSVRNYLDPLSECLELRLGFSCMRDFSPSGILENVPELRELLAKRDRIAGLRGPWTSRAVPGFRESLLRAVDPAELRGVTRATPERGGPTLIERIVAEAHLTPADADAYELLRDGVSTLLSLLSSDHKQSIPAYKDLLEAVLSDLDATLCKQLDEILHHPAFQALESSWRGVAFLLERIDPAANIAVDLAQVTMAELRDDLANSPTVWHSWLSELLRPQTLGSPPYTLVCALYELSPSREDMDLMTSLAAIAARSHTVVLLNAHPRMFGVDSFGDLLRLRDLQALFEMPKYMQWNAFRETIAARFFGVCLPRFLLREPYQPASGRNPLRNFVYAERVGADVADYLWGPASLVLVIRIADAFARHGWCADITGSHGGGTERALPAWRPQSGKGRRVVGPCDVFIGDSFDQQLAELGFIPLISRHDSDEAVFFSAPSPHEAPMFPRTVEGARARALAILNIRLPYTLIVSRIVHYIEAIHEEASGLPRPELARLLTRWLQQYVSPVPDPPPDVLARKPFRIARIRLDEGTEVPIEYRLDIAPHLHQLDANAQISTTGVLDRGLSAGRHRG